LIKISILCPFCCIQLGALQSLEAEVTVTVTLRLTFCRVLPGANSQTAVCGFKIIVCPSWGALSDVSKGLSFFTSDSLCRSYTSMFICTRFDLVNIRTFKYLKLCTIYCIKYTTVYTLYRLCCSMYCLFDCVVLCIVCSIVLFYVLFVDFVFLSIIVCKYVPYYCHRVPTQLQLNISYIILYRINIQGL
jgi:hypothetical protein